MRTGSSPASRPFHPRPGLNLRIQPGSGRASCFCLWFCSDRSISCRKVTLYFHQLNLHLLNTQFLITFKYSRWIQRASGGAGWLPQWVPCSPTSATLESHQGSAPCCSNHEPPLKHHPETKLRVKKKNSVHVELIEHFILFEIKGDFKYKQYFW